MCTKYDTKASLCHFYTYVSLEFVLIHLSPVLPFPDNTYLKYQYCLYNRGFCDMEKGVPRKAIRLGHLGCVLKDKDPRSVYASQPVFLCPLFCLFLSPHIELQPIPGPWTALRCLRMELTSSHFQAGAPCVV